MTSSNTCNLIDLKQLSIIPTKISFFEYLQLHNTLKCGLLNTKALIDFKENIFSKTALVLVSDDKTIFVFQSPDPFREYLGSFLKSRRRVSSVVEHSSANPWIMMRHVACILLLEWSTTSPYAQKDPRFLFEMRRGQTREFWSLDSTIDGSTLPQDCVEEQLCSWTRINW